MPSCHDLVDLLPRRSSKETSDRAAADRVALLSRAPAPRPPSSSSPASFLAGLEKTTPALNARDQVRKKVISFKKTKKLLVRRAKLEKKAAAAAARLAKTAARALKVNARRAAKAAAKASKRQKTARNDELPRTRRATSRPPATGCATASDVAAPAAPTGAAAGTSPADRPTICLAEALVFLPNASEASQVELVLLPKCCMPLAAYTGKKNFTLKASDELSVEVQLENKCFRPKKFPFDWPSHESRCFSWSNRDPFEAWAEFCAKVAWPTP